MNIEPTLWGIHAGKTGDADALFLRQKRIGLGWDRMPNLAALAAEREAFKEAVTQHYPEFKERRIPGSAGQLFRFIHEMQVGDFVVYPAKHTRKVHLGKVAGPYVHDTRTEPSYPHTRQVEWLREVPRTHFSQGALYEIGSALSLFAVRNYADEFRAALAGKAVTPAPVNEDESVAAVAADIEETTRDFVLKRLAQELKGHPFAAFVGHLLNTMGYRTRVSPPGPDGGVDIVAHKDELGFEPPIIKVQVKSEEGSIGDPEVSSLYGKVGTGEHGLFVTLGEFTSRASAFAKSKSNLRLIDGDDLVQLIFAHYDQFDARYKGLLPLRRVFVPEAVEDVEE